MIIHAVEFHSGHIFANPFVSSKRNNFAHRRGYGLETNKYEFHRYVEKFCIAKRTKLLDGYVEVK